MTLKVEEAIKKEIPVVISAGNYAEMHWEGTYSEGAVTNGMHEFAEGDEIQGIYVDGNLNPIFIYMVWDNQGDNLDLFLRHESSDEILEESRNIQTRNTGEAYEYVSFQPQKAGIYEFGVSCVNASGCNPDTVLEVFSITHTFEHSTPQGSVGVPVDAEGVISVGAIDFLSEPFRPYSSQGPANNLHDAPLLVAPDGVQTTAYEKYGGGPFFGTSAAAPHVAGVAALLLEKEPKLTPAQLLENLRDYTDQNAVPLAKPSDNKFGFGKVDASFIVTGEQFQGTLRDFDNGIQDNLPKQQEDLFPKEPPLELVIPEWIKQNAAWWAAEEIDDTSFLSGIEYMVQKEIIIIPGEGKYLKLNANKFVKPYSVTATNEIEISGFVEDFRDGSSIFMEIIKPDGIIEEQKLVGAKGNFLTKYYLDLDSPVGVYKIIINYQEIEVDSKEFEVTNYQKGQTIEEYMPQVPQWVRSNADWWAQGLITDNEFAAGISFLIEQSILVV